MNKSILIGYLTKDPEFYTTTNGVSVCRFTVAVNRKFVKEDGTRDCDFINCVAWRGLADNVNKYCKKGHRVSVVGSIQTRVYDAEDGSKRFATEIVAEEVEFLQNKNANQTPGPTDSDAPPTQSNVLGPIDDNDLPF